MPDEDPTSTDEENEQVSPEAKQRLIKELKERLKEIERLKKELGSIPDNEEKNSDEEKEKSAPFSFSRVREEVEELRVPPLELLEDKPLPKKKKLGEITS